MTFSNLLYLHKTKVKWLCSRNFSFFHGHVIRQAILHISYPLIFRIHGNLVSKNRPIMAALKKKPLTLPEYERIFRTIHGVLLNEDSQPEKACMYFALIGALLLQKHHKLQATLRIGAAAYNLRTPTNAVLVLGESDGDALSSSHEAFHCWVEVDGWVIDFSAPLFNDMIEITRTGKQIPPNMFQKPASALSALSELNALGAYCHASNPSIHSRLVSHFCSLPANADLVEICQDWYRVPPKKVSELIQISNQHGEVSRVSHSPIRVTGAW